jgi:hypothetical protein
MKLKLINGKPEQEKRQEPKKKANDDDEKILNFAIEKFRMMKKKQWEQGIRREEIIECS